MPTSAVNEWQIGDINLFHWHRAARAIKTYDISHYSIQGCMMKPAMPCLWPYSHEGVESIDDRQRPPGQNCHSQGRADSRMGLSAISLSLAAPIRRYVAGDLPLPPATMRHANFYSTERASRNRRFLAASLDEMKSIRREDFIPPLALKIYLPPADDEQIYADM